MTPTPRRQDIYNSMNNNNDYENSFEDDLNDHFYGYDANELGTSQNSNNNANNNNLIFYDDITPPPSNPSIHSIHNIYSPPLSISNINNDTINKNSNNSNATNNNNNSNNNNDNFVTSANFPSYLKLYNNSYANDNIGNKNENDNNNNGLEARAPSQSPAITTKRSNNNNNNNNNDLETMDSNRMGLKPSSSPILPISNLLQPNQFSFSLFSFFFLMLSFCIGFATFQSTDLETQKNQTKKQTDNLNRHQQRLRLLQQQQQAQLVHMELAVV